MKLPQFHTAFEVCTSFRLGSVHFLCVNCLVSELSWEGKEAPPTQGLCVAKPGLTRRGPRDGERTVQKEGFLVTGAVFSLEVVSSRHWRK